MLSREPQDWQTGRVSELADLAPGLVDLAILLAKGSVAT
jgi:hypothetical protein